MEQTKTVLVVMGSLRASRICPQIANWVAEIGRHQTGLAYEIVDLADWPLPMDDEPAIPALGPYAQAHTRAWSAEIESAAGIVFVTPQYNWGYPAALKNAIDHLYREWHGKPVAVITYGGHGGGKCAKQLKQVAKAVKMRLVSPMPGIVLSNAIIRENAPFEPSRDFAKYAALIRKSLTRQASLINGGPSGWRTWFGA